MDQSREEVFDVAVVGGGSAGVAAAVAAARQGARTVLVERYGFLGGAATNSLVLTYDGFFYRRPVAEWAVGGIAREVLRQIERLGMAMVPVLSPSGNWLLPFNPEASKAALDALVIEAGVTTRLHALAIEAARDGNRIEAVTVADHAGRLRIVADCFVDASGEGDLAALAGGPMAFADQPRQAASLCLRIAGLAREVTPALFAEVVGQGRPAFGKARLRTSGGFCLPLADNGDLWWMGIDVATDGLTSASLTEAEQDCRAAAWAFIRDLRRVPGCERAVLVGSGSQMGIRETRHPLARQTISQADALAGQRSETTVGRAAWPLERHDSPGRPTIALVGGEGFFDIPADSLRAAELDNLWLAGRLAGADRGACSSLRVMGTAFVSGQAAGTAAALAAGERHGYPALRSALLEGGAVFD